MKHKLATYLFAFFTLTYLVGVSGIPVYFHYCGGQLEEISYLTKVNSCCGDEEPADADCCSDENIVIRSTPETNLASVQKLLPQQEILFVHLPFSFVEQTSFLLESTNYSNGLPPPRLQNQLISCAVLRI